MNEFKFTQELDAEDLYVGLCKIDDSKKNIIKKNPHCAEYFCNLNNIFDCSKCSSYLKKNNILNFDPLYTKIDKTIVNNKLKEKHPNNCPKNCTSGFLYDFIPKEFAFFNKQQYLDEKTAKLDKFRTVDKFYKDSLIYKYDDIPYELNYELTYPRPKSVVHWGQLKMFLVLLMFFTQVIDINDTVVHVVYPGSARGDNILILADMFPCIKWYLIDPSPFHKDLYTHERVIEIKNEFFTDELATYYGSMFTKEFRNGNKVLFISDIRIAASDNDVKRDNDDDARWHSIIKPDFGYLKFRCPYEGEDKYKFFDGKIYIQPFAPTGSTESRILCETELKERIYDIHEYQGKFFYFNRILRPSYYTKAIIKDNDYFDHCYDCTYFSYLIKNYLDKFSKVPKNIFYNVKDILQVMTTIKDRLLLSTMDRVKLSNDHIRNNLTKSHTSMKRTRFIRKEKLNHTSK